MLVIMAGLPATGKTTLARELAGRTRGAILNKDVIRAALFSTSDIEYSSRQDDFVMRVMLDAARYLLQNAPTRIVFLDGRTFSRAYQLDTVLEVARELAQPWIILECVCSDDTARRRLHLERDPSHPAQNRNFALYLKMKTQFEPIRLAKTIISTDQEIARCTEQGLSAIASR